MEQEPHYIVFDSWSYGLLEPNPPLNSFWPEGPTTLPNQTIEAMVEVQIHKMNYASVGPGTSYKIMGSTDPKNRLKPGIIQYLYGGSYVWPNSMRYKIMEFGTRGYSEIFEKID
jgi:hypothetical protein